MASAATFHGVDALLGFDTGMGLLAVNCRRDIDGGRRPIGDGADVPGGIENEPIGRVEAAQVHLAGSEQPTLLANGDNELEGRMLHLGMGLEDGQQLQTSGDARLVVCAEDGRPVGPYDPVLDDRTYTCVGPSGVHMGRQQHRVGSASGEDGHQVPDVVPRHSAAEFVESGR